MLSGAVLSGAVLSGAVLSGAVARCSFASGDASDAAGTSDIVCILPLVSRRVTGQSAETGLNSRWSDAERGHRGTVANCPSGPRGSSGRQAWAHKVGTVGARKCESG
ncbi:pentapeptide repeat-containing protein [Nocardia bovistercoris]|uniref:pentapeptide repeat-containing protein n=1 Tax=Nocardia bovistercoris TaxID=2785916 RepID=UPI0038CD187C